MQCFVCSKTKIDKQAVAICPSCSVGLCTTHLASNGQRLGSGTSWGSCGHLSARVTPTR